MVDYWEEKKIWAHLIVPTGTVMSTSLATVEVTVVGAGAMAVYCTVAGEALHVTFLSQKKQMFVERLEIWKLASNWRCV